MRAFSFAVLSWFVFVLSRLMTSWLFLLCPCAFTLTQMRLALPLCAPPRCSLGSPSPATPIRVHGTPASARNVCHPHTCPCAVIYLFCLFASAPCVSKSTPASPPVLQHALFCAFPVPKRPNTSPQTLNHTCMFLCDHAHYPTYMHALLPKYV